MTISSLLRPLFKSTDANTLDRDQDQAYIINQVLAFGSLVQLKELFHLYGKEKIREIFLHQPIKIYQPDVYHYFLLLFGVSKDEAPEYRYDRYTPRHIG